MIYRPLLPPDLLSLLPPYFKAIKDFVAIMETENIELEKFEIYLWLVQDNFFIQTCDEATLRYHETLLKIKVSQGDTIDFRRLRVLNRYNNKPPLTLPVLKERLNMLVGVGDYIVDIDYGNYHLTLTVNSGVYGIIDELIYTLIYMLPAHLTFKIIQNILTYTKENIYIADAATSAMYYFLT